MKYKFILFSPWLLKRVTCFGLVYSAGPQVNEQNIDIIIICIYICDSTCASIPYTRLGSWVGYGTESCSSVYVVRKA